MTKTPIQKMIEKLEAMNKVLVGLTGEYTTLKDVRAFMAELLKTAHTYASEEQSQKPAAPADLGEFEKYMEKIIGMVMENPDCDERDLLANRSRNILSEYRRLAVLESERQGEVVLGSVVYHERTDEVPLLEWFGRNYANFKKIYGKLGVLVFRPEESK